MNLSDIIPNKHMLSFNVSMLRVESFFVYDLAGTCFCLIFFNIHFNMALKSASYQLGTPVIQMK